MNVPLIVRLYKGEQLLEVKQFDSDQIVIGHNAEVHLDLDDESISPIHAMIESRDSGFFICDLGSQSGTKLNGKKILDEKVESGDRIEIGPFLLEFYIGVPKPKSKPPAPPVGAPVKTAASQVKPASPPKEKNTVQADSSAKGPNSEAPKVADDQAVNDSRSESAFEAAEATIESSSDLTEVLRPAKGPVVQVTVCWADRILKTHHFEKSQMVTIGRASAASIRVEALGWTKLPIVQIGSDASVILTPEIEGEYIVDRQRTDLRAYAEKHPSRQLGRFTLVDIQQGHMVHLRLVKDNIDVYVRYVEKAPPVVLAPLLDFSISEWTGIVLSVALSLLMALYVSLYGPTEIEKDQEEEIQRIAKFIYKKPPPAPTPPPAPVPEAKPEPKKLNVSDRPTAAKQSVKSTIKPKPVKSPPKGASGKAGGLKARKAKKKKGFGAIKRGGAKKLGKKQGANAKSKKKDVTKLGLFSALGGGGVRKNVDTSYDGAGELIGLGARATGTSGQNEDRPGDGIGSKLKEVGGGAGTQTQGISGVTTRGRGSGNAGYGAGGGGLGDKGRVLVTPGGQEEKFTGTIDREAVRRVVKAGLRQVRNCYERELNRSPGLSGKIVVRWEIGEQGRVLSTRMVSSTLRSQRVARCVQLKIRSWRFPEPPEGVVAVVDFPFVFVSNQ